MIRDMALPEPLSFPPARSPLPGEAEAAPEHPRVLSCARPKTDLAEATTQFIKAMKSFKYMSPRDP